MTNVRPPGIHMPDSLRHSLDTHLAEHVELLAAQRRPATVRQGGMETARSAFLVLKLGDSYYFLVERRWPDSGECWPTLFKAPDGIDFDDEQQLLQALTAFGNRDAGPQGVREELGSGIALDEDAADYLADVLWELLYARTRDVISPDALRV